MICGFVVGMDEYRELLSQASTLLKSVNLDGVDDSTVLAYVSTAAQLTSAAASYTTAKAIAELCSTQTESKHQLTRIARKLDS